ncbi:hypothetical protein LJR289_003213 [Pseudoduganella sp. LjRoot289]|uniref:hypothetical protein n=1 Tax=Pseudoduganella sp. LjRoot289 TaxID=3342314 RepID=UPI003ECDEB67
MGHDDYQQRKQQWLAQIEEFYSQVQLWLEPYAIKHQVKYDFHSVLLAEELLGSYATRSMGIKLGRQHVVLRPVGAMLGASGGRIDLEGHRGKVCFVQPNFGTGWKIATKDGEFPAYEDFNEDNFFEALLEVSSD